jgi:ATP-dependent DNA helicase RecG
MDVTRIEKDEMNALLDLNEDHFNDIKSKRIAPAKLQETFVAFANSDDGDLYIGIEDKSEKGGRLVGFDEQEEANAIISTLLEETNPAVENVLIEFLDTQGSGLLLHFGIPKSPKVHYTAAGDCYIRVNASKKKIKGERITQLGYSKGAEPYERRALNDVDIEDIKESKLLAAYMYRVGTHLEPESFLRKQRLLTFRRRTAGYA